MQVVFFGVSQEFFFMHRAYRPVKIDPRIIPTPIFAPLFMVDFQTCPIITKVGLKIKKKSLIFFGKSLFLAT